MERGVDAPALTKEMVRYFSNLFATDFLPHGVCMRWQPGVLWLHVISDAIITLAYLCIPILLLAVIRKRKDVPFHWMFLAFGTFILACGATHALGIVTLWVPVYRLDGLVKAVTAVASITTAVCLACLMPVLRKMPTASQWEATNQALEEEIAKKQEIAKALEGSQEELIARVQERTLELSQLNLTLEQKVNAEQRTSNAFRDREQQFRLACEFGQVETWAWDLQADTFAISSSHCDQDCLHIEDYFATILPEDRTLARKTFHDARSLVSDFSVEFRALRADGRARWVSARGAMEHSAAGLPLRMSGVTIDISGRKDAEVALRKSEKEFEILADAIPNLAWMAHADGFIFWYNRQWYEYTNTTPQQMEGWGWQSVHDPEHLPFVMKRWTECIRAGTPFEMEFPLRGGDGKFRWFLTRVTPVIDAAGRATRWFGTNTDVTAIRKVAEALRESESHFRQIANSLPQMLWIAGPEGAVQWLNQRWYDYTGSTLDQSKRDEWMQYTHPECRELGERRWKSSVATAELLENESRFRRHDGVYRWFLVNGNPVVRADGEIVKWFVTFTDVEDYKRAEAEILALNRDLESRVTERTMELSRTNDRMSRTQTWLRAVLDSATQAAVIAVDNDGIIMLFNSGAERLLGYAAEDLVGKCSPDMLQNPSEQGRRWSIEALPSAVEPHSSYASESVFIHRDGARIDVSLAYTPMIDSNGERLGTLGIAMDIRPQKALEHQLQEKTRCAEVANRAKSDFLAAMSHEIRTPMNAILGMADLLWESELETTQRQYVEVFRRACSNLLTLVNDILDLSKIEAGQFELERIDFDLVDVVERTVEMIRSKTQAKGIIFLSRIAPGTPSHLVGDPTRLQQVLINLLGNAVKFTERGEISLTVSVDPQDATRLRFEVTDTGIGIPPDKLESIFNDFTQAESSTTRRFGGTGLGLGICRRLVRRMGGRLSVRSEFGKGSSFEFDAALEKSTKDKLQPVDPVTGVAGRTVLIVDNNATNRLIFSEMCTAWGMEPSECASVGTAITTLQAAGAAKRPFDLIILDRLMPGLDGFELVALIRQVDAGVPIILATSDRIPGDETRSKQLGLAGYAVKPVRRSELLRMVCNSLSGRDAVAISRQEITAPSHVPVRKGRILVAEDSEDNRFLLQAYLKNAPYEITFVENGELAVKSAARNPFDLILMDMQMPVLDGLAATRTIRVSERDQGKVPTPIVALTANARREDIEASKDAGCNSHLSKPITKALLLTTIQANIRNVDERMTPPSVPFRLPLGRVEVAKVQTKEEDEALLIN